MKPPRPRGDEVRALLSLREAALLADVAESKIRKDIETGLLAPIKSADHERLFFRWADVFVFAAVYRGDLFSGPLRKKAFDALEELMAPSSRREFYARLDVAALLAASCAWRRPSEFFAAAGRLKLDDYLYLDLGEISADLSPRIDHYAEGLTRIEEKEGVLGGEAVFKGTRLSVNHIGKLREGGETVESIVQDYPYLRRSDVDFAQLYVKAHPGLGRPRRFEGIGLASSPSPR
jgi:uncharacterized protein (DUF433 family)